MILILFKRFILKWNQFFEVDQRPKTITYSYLFIIIMFLQIFLSCSKIYSL